MVGLCTRLAIERAGTETPHLKQGAPDFYPSEETGKCTGSRIGFPTPERKKPRQTMGPSRGSGCPTNETREGSRTETARLRDLVAWHFRRRITCRIRSWVGHRLRRFISRIARGIVQGLERRVLCGRIYRIVQRLRRGLLRTSEDDHWRSDHS